MLPPLFLRPESGEYVLDMCAAPGSKTCQLLEMIQHSAGDRGGLELGGGCIIANDVDQKRAFMLSH
jgi:16S rRNA C967 or C1407 C5-methylase (RsmB/RsmF family)